MKKTASKTIRALMKTTYMFSIRDLSVITGRSEIYVARLFACLRNKYRCGAPGPLLVKSIKYPDGVKRWGNLTATEIYEINKSKIAELDEE